jgi:NAD(P)H-dependent FMN reductase
MTALDWYYDEWHAKSVAIVSYGREHGGCHATAQLRQVFTELQAVTIRNTVALPCYWEQCTRRRRLAQAFRRLRGSSQNHARPARLVGRNSTGRARNKRPYQP